MPTVHTKPVGRDKRPDLEAKLRLGARLNCLDVTTALDSKISVVLPSLCKDSLALPVLL